MYALCEATADRTGMELIVHVNRECVELGINSFDHGSAVHTDMWETEGLKQALDLHGFDRAFGGARRDGERSRAKEGLFSLRSARQRPELWCVHNACPTRTT